MHRWQVGDVDVVRIEDFDLPLPASAPLPDWCVPELAPTPDEYRIAFSALALADGDRRIVVDPWLVTDRATVDVVATADRLLGELSTAGFPPDDVDTVVYSHLDQIGWGTRPDGDDWVPAFPNATYLFPAEDIAAADAGEDIPGREDFLHLCTVAPVDGVDAPRAVSAAVSLEPTGGHGWGHLAVRIEDEGALAYYLGHLLLHPRQFTVPGPDPEESSSYERAAEARCRMLDELADRAGLALTTLVGGPGGGVVERDGDGFRLRFAPT